MGLVKAVRVLRATTKTLLPIVLTPFLAPGFQTSVKRIRVTPEIAARIKRGEEVSPEEIAEAAARAEKLHQDGDQPPLVETAEKPQDSATDSANEWLPESLTKPKKRGKARRR
jgi:hypothetical protein